VVSKRDLIVQIRDVLSAAIVVLDLATAVSLFVAMLVILTSINLSVLENARDFATLRTLGYSQGSIATAILTEAGLYAVGAVLLSIPVAAAISAYLNQRMAVAWFQVESIFPAAAFAKVLVPALVLIPLGSWPGIRHVMSHGTLASLRSRILE